MASEEEDKASKEGGVFSIWGFGSSVLENVTQNASSFVNTIVETDWNKELQEIQEGLKQDTQQFEHEVEKKLGLGHAHGEASTSRAAAPQRSDTTDLITDFGRRLVHGTAEIIQQVRQQVDAEFTNLEQEAAKKPRSTFPKRTGGAKFSRLDMQMSAMQRNSATYCDEPGDKEQYVAFLDTYDIEARQAEAEQILANNPFMSELHSRLVPLVIANDTFWQRYFFRAEELKREHEKRHQRLKQAHRHAGGEVDEPLDDSASHTPPKRSPTLAAEAAPAFKTPPMASADSMPDAGAEQHSAAAPQAMDTPPMLPKNNVASGGTHGPGKSSSPEAGGALPVSDARQLSPATREGEATPPVSQAEPAVMYSAEDLQTDITPEQGHGAVTPPHAEHAADAPKSLGTGLAAVAGGLADERTGTTAAPAVGATVESEESGRGGKTGEVPGVAEDHDICGSSGAGSAARSPQSSGNANASSEWSVVSGTQAPLCATAAVPENGTHRETVSAVEEGEEGREDIEVQEEDIAFDDLDSLGGDVVDDGEGDDEIDENWGQWE